MPEALPLPDSCHLVPERKGRKSNHRARNFTWGVGGGLAIFTRRTFLHQIASSGICVAGPVHLVRNRTSASLSSRRTWHAYTLSICK